MCIEPNLVTESQTQNKPKCHVDFKVHILKKALHSYQCYGESSNLRSHYMLPNTTLTKPRAQPKNSQPKTHLSQVNEVMQGFGLVQVFLFSLLVA